jgi:hypothetical protein
MGGDTGFSAEFIPANSGRDMCQNPGHYLVKIPFQLPCTPDISFNPTQVELVHIRRNVASSKKQVYGERKSTGDEILLKTV